MDRPLLRPFRRIKGGGSNAIVGNFHDASLVVVLAAAVALQALSHQSEEHLPAEIAECGRLVRVNGQRVRIDDLRVGHLLPTTAQGRVVD